jgi:NAD(P)H-hydrate epimerase
LNVKLPHRLAHDLRYDVHQHAMKVFTPQQMRDFDCAATEQFGVPSVVLMENAALRVVEFLEMKFAPLKGKYAVVLCGKGNNGGDGFAIARHLEARGCHCRVLLAASADDLKGDARINFEILKRTYEMREVLSQIKKKPYEKVVSQWRPLFFWDEKFDFAVDALLGTGFKGEIRDGTLDNALIELRERGQTPLVSVDIPSGLNADTGEQTNRAARADYTVTFVAPKPGMFLRDGLECCGEIWVGDIGTPGSATEANGNGINCITRDFARELLPQRPLDAHKGDAGRVVICGGSFGMSGAPTLAARASLRVGAGLCAACLPERIMPSFAGAFLEATSHSLPCDEDGRLIEAAADLFWSTLRGRCGRRGGRVSPARKARSISRGV